MASTPFSYSGKMYEFWKCSWWEKYRKKQYGLKMIVRNSINYCFVPWWLEYATQNKKNIKYEISFTWFLTIPRTGVFGSERTNNIFDHLVVKICNSQKMSYNPEWQAQNFLSVMWPPFCHFQSGKASKWQKKLHYLYAISCVHVFTHCACTRAGALAQTI